MATNTAYYEAEQALRAKLAAMDVDYLRCRLDSIVRRADPDFNRELFAAFGIVETAGTEA
jgi:hypothetical protein